MRLTVVLGARSHLASFGPLVPELEAAGFDVRAVSVDDSAHAGRLPVSSGFDASEVDAVLVMGDADAALYAAIEAARSGMPVVHVDAGLRCGDLGRRDEVNRVLISRIASMHLVPTEEALETLEDEGVEPERIHFVGSMRAQTALRTLQAVRGRSVAAERGFERDSYVLVNVGEPGNVDDPSRLRAARDGLSSAPLPVLVIDDGGWTRSFDGDEDFTAPSITISGPVEHDSMIALIRDAAAVLTDAGGVQVEACVIGTPCITLLPCTEQSQTTVVGANVLVPPDPTRIGAALRGSLSSPRGWVVPKRWDEAVSERVVRALRRGIIPLS